MALWFDYPRFTVERKGRPVPQQIWQSPRALACGSQAPFTVLDVGAIHRDVARFHGLPPSPLMRQTC